MQHEQLLTLAEIQGVRAVTWDSMGELIVVAVEASHKGTPVVVPVHMKPSVAQALLNQLEQTLSEKPSLMHTMQ